MTNVLVHILQWVKYFGFVNVYKVSMSSDLDFGTLTAQTYYIEDLIRVVILYDIYETRLRRVS